MSTPDIPPRLPGQVTELMERLQTDQKGFVSLSQLLHCLSGIHLPLNDKNLILMASRLNPILRDIGLTQYAQYEDYLRSGDKAAIAEFISCLTTNTTEFFREKPHFDILREQLPILYRAKAGIRIWCAAASSGQEPYSIAITALETLPNERAGLRVLATDINLEVLEKGAQGIYTEQETAGVPPLFKQKYFRQADRANGKAFALNEELRSLVRFAPLNLIADQYPFNFPFDVIFCRNVLIYFDRETALRVVDRLLGTLAPGGLLFLGHSETAAVRRERVEPVAPAVYRRRVSRK